MQIAALGTDEWKSPILKEAEQYLQLFRGVFIFGGIMKDKLHEVYNCLKIMDMLLYKHGYEPQTVVGFKSTEDMAKYYREFLHVILPEEYRYNKEE